jgi:hypothetical protein
VSPLPLPPPPPNPRQGMAPISRAFVLVMTAVAMLTTAANAQDPAPAPTSDGQFSIFFPSFSSMRSNPMRVTLEEDPEPDFGVGLVLRCLQEQVWTKGSPTCSCSWRFYSPTLSTPWMPPPRTSSFEFMLMICNLTPRCN